MKAFNNPFKLNYSRALSTLLYPTLLLALTITSCQEKKKPQPPVKISRDQVFQSTLSDIRLGDGIPLDVDLSIRWRVEDYEKFSLQFKSPDHYDSLILAPRQHELANKVSNTYHHVDSVFTTQKHQFVNELKKFLKGNLGEPGITIKEVIVAEVRFPVSYTQNKEVLATQEQELNRIRRQALIDLEKRDASRKMAEAQGKVDMAKAEMEAKVQRIKAETEKSIRASKLAKAETDKQVSRLRAQSEAERKELMAKVDLKKRRDLKNLEMQKRKELDKIALNKQRGLDKIAVDKKIELEKIKLNQDLQMAKLCSENPTYANYMVNRELASKVQIAVLPATKDASVFNNLLSNGMTKK